MHGSGWRSFYIACNLDASSNLTRAWRTFSVDAGERYDAIVVGSGQAGTPLSRALAEAGMGTALVEREHVGGTCVNEGCTPTKTMVASARVAYLARRGANYGVQTGPITIDLKRVRERKREIVKSFRDGSQARIEKTPNLSLIFGTASFTGPNTLAIHGWDGSERSLMADKIFINAGTRAARPALEGLDLVPFLDNKSMMELDAVPEHLIVLGGGYIGLEFGQMFRRFGSQVTIIQRAARLVTIEDEDVSDEVAAILRDDGITVLTSSTPVRAEPADGGRLRLTVRTQDGERQLEGSHLLSAIGRIPNTEALSAEAAGIRLSDHGFIEVDEYLQTSVPGVYAMGDVKGGPAFTHLSYDDYRILHANLIRHEKASTRDRIVPYTVFIDPQLGRVGMTEREARAQRRAIRVAKLPMSAVIRAIETGETRGFIKAVVDADSGQILGCAVLGSEGGEIMTMIQVAMLGKLTSTAMADAIFTHPLLAEGLNTLFAMFDA